MLMIFLSGNKLLCFCSARDIFTFKTNFLTKFELCSTCEDLLTTQWTALYLHEMIKVIPLLPNQLNLIQFT
jgi:hypothetical protein